MIEGKPAPALTLLASKTKIPFVRQGTLVRSRLTSLLTDADTPLSLVVAPAGWGKTTLLAQWARVTSRSHPVGWVTLDATDNEPHRFWSYVITSLRHAGSQVGESALAALGVPRLDPIEVAIPRLLNDFAATDQPHSMVFDDYHLVDDRQIREAVEFFITYLPANAKAIIGSRLDPPLPLALWRGRGMVTEVRAEHLRFEADEVTELLGQVATMQNDRSQTADVMARTEGWAAGLQLVLMAVRRAQDPARQAAAMR
jgi:LuxR family maltose regulon positive regulatory protein